MSKRMFRYRAMPISGCALLAVGFDLRPSRAWLSFLCHVSPRRIGHDEPKELNRKDPHPLREVEEFLHGESGRSPGNVAFFDLACMRIRVMDVSFGQEPVAHIVVYGVFILAGGLSHER